MQRRGRGGLGLPAPRHRRPPPADGALWCRLTRPVAAGGRLSVLLAAEPHSAPSQPVKEPVEPEGLAPSPATDIQLLPQQAGMASILATAVVNSE